MQGSVLADWQKDKPSNPAFAAPQQTAGAPAFVDQMNQQSQGVYGLNVRPQEPEPVAPTVDPTAPAPAAPATVDPGPVAPQAPVDPNNPTGNPYLLENAQNNAAYQRKISNYYTQEQFQQTGGQLPPGWSYQGVPDGQGGYIMVVHDSNGRPMQSFGSG